MVASWITSLSQLPTCQRAHEMDGSVARRKRFVAHFDFLPLKSNALTSKWVRELTLSVSPGRKKGGKWVPDFIM